MVGYDEEVDKFDMTGYSDVKGQFVSVFDSDDNEEMKKDFLMKNGEKISHEAVLGVLWV